LRQEAAAETDDAVEFINGSVAPNTRVVFGNAFAADESGVALVAAARVNFSDANHWGFDFLILRHGFHG
jgi:hypothetical protein